MLSFYNIIMYFGTLILLVFFQKYQFPSITLSLLFLFSYWDLAKGTIVDPSRISE